MHKYSNLRPPDAILPIAFLAASILGHEPSALTLFVCALIIHALSLASSHGVQAAFAWQTSIKDVRGSVKAALLLQCAGFMISMALLPALLPDRRAALLPMLGAGWLLNIEHTFYEYLYAAGDGYSAALCQGLTGLFTLAGLSLAGGNTKSPWIPGMAGLAASVALVIAIAMGDGATGRLNAQVLKCAPRAMIYSLLYPAAFCAASRLVRLPSPAVPFFAGLAVYALCRTPYRRARVEAAPMNRLLLLLCAAASAGALAEWYFTRSTLLRPFNTACGAVILAAICAFAAFGNVSRA